MTSWAGGMIYQEVVIKNFSRGVQAVDPSAAPIKALLLAGRNNRLQGYLFDSTYS